MEATKREKIFKQLMGKIEQAYGAELKEPRNKAAMDKVRLQESEKLIETHRQKSTNLKNNIEKLRKDMKHSAPGKMFTITTEISKLRMELAINEEMIQDMETNIIPEMNKTAKESQELLDRRMVVLSRNVKKETQNLLADSILNDIAPFMEAWIDVKSKVSFPMDIDIQKLTIESREALDVIEKLLPTHMTPAFLSGVRARSLATQYPTTSPSNSL